SSPAVEGQVFCAEHRAEQAARDAARVASGKNAECLRAHRERLRSRTPAQVEADRRRLRPSGVKRCRVCREELPFSAFAGNRTQADGLNQRCMRCNNASLLRRALPRWEALDTWGCVYCGAEFEDLDHVIPRALGGTDDPINCVPSCATCNRSKRDRQVVDW